MAVTPASHGRGNESDGPIAAPSTDEAIEFEYEGFFTHWVCPECGHNDYSEGDTRGDPVECPICHTKGVLPS